MRELHRVVEGDRRQIRRHPSGRLVANSGRGFRGFFGPDGLTVVPEGIEAGSENEAPWTWSYALVAAGREGALRPVGECVPRCEGNRVIYERGFGMAEIWENQPEGLEQSVYLAQPVGGTGSLLLEGEHRGTLQAIERDGRVLLCSGASEVLVYRELVVRDARGQELPSSMHVDGDVLRLRIDDSNAVYPIEVDPLLTNASWSADPTDQASAYLGIQVCGAGDVNGDGYDDVVVGAWWWDGESSDEGRVYVYHGGAAGLSAADSPDWTADPTDQGARFGVSVSKAGDVNGDGFGDVIVGAYLLDGEVGNEGRGYVYPGGAGGLSAGALRIG